MLQAMVRDISERKQMERERVSHQKQFETFTQSNPAGILVRVGEKIVYANQQAADILEYPLEELIGLDAIEITPPKDKAKLLESIEEEKIDKNAGFDKSHFESQAVTKTGRMIWLDYWTTSMEYYGEPCRLILILDISETKANQDLLRRQKEELSELASMMSHDLGNYMSNIIALTQLYKTVRDDEILSRIESIAFRTSELFKMSAELANEGYLVYDQERVELTIVVSDIAKQVIPSDIEFACDNLPTVRGNSKRIEQVFSNLFENAIEHGSPKKITVSHEINEDCSALTISNDGEAIPQGIRGKIFSRGFSTKKEGKGFGLSIVRKLVEAHGWTITLDPDPMTTFRIKIN
jgi:PAS domain S-box-containing protein